MINWSAGALWSISESVSAVGSSAGTEGDVGWGEDVISGGGLGPGAGVESVNLHGRDVGDNGGDEKGEFHFVNL